MTANTAPTGVTYSKAPFPWFGGKAKAAPVVWAALGDVAHYVEPFAGTLAVLLNRPHPCNRAYSSETVNAEAHGRRSRTVQPLVGSLDGDK